MYIPAQFNEERTGVLQGFISAQPFCTLVTIGSEGLIASHIPLLLNPQTGVLGVLRGHMAKANPQWRNYSVDVEALAIFNGPHHYVSPSWYPSKDEHGKVVPTWNYVTVHAYGRMRVVEEREQLLGHLRLLTESQESGRPSPWRVEDAPGDYIDGMMRAIVGVEIEITRLEGKWKVSQNRPPSDREGVIRALREEGGERAGAMAGLIENRSSKPG